jgi:hypothetical protein
MTSRRALAFSCVIRFFDEEANVFRLPVHGCTENDILSTGSTLLDPLQYVFVVDVFICLFICLFVFVLEIDI